ncbi:MAG TPA: ATP-binding cassette domain-containing protein, partial [Burkholderiales bacterium]
MSALLSVQSLDLYYGDAQALSEVSIKVPRGEIVAIIGANGAGKTSLIRTIAGIERARAGRIEFAGRDITALDSHQTCDLGIGQVAEGRQVFPTLTVHENLEVGGLLPRARGAARRALDEVYALFPKLAERREQAAGT